MGVRLGRNEEPLALNKSNAFLFSYLPSKVHPLHSDTNSSNHEIPSPGSELLVTAGATSFFPCAALKRERHDWAKKNVRRRREMSKADV